MNALIAGALITWPFLVLFCIGQWLVSIPRAG